MALRFFNTLTRETEEFRPIEPGRVKLYTCGPTVYNFAHIGNFRTYVFEDVLRRALKYFGFLVTQVMNLTDVEDKIIRRSQEEKVPFREITERYIETFFEDLDRLNIERAEHYPKATESVDKMAEIIRKLVADGIAYRSEDGSIYYNIARFPAYGRLARIQVDELQAGARVKQDEYEKECACDFALWKAWDPGDGEVFWDGYPDLGKGRPGWHIECSAMSIMLLGNHFDIHTGGVDNIFPHHQNEIAQSEAFTGETFVNYWLHSEHLQVESSKMSKSKGNFFTLRDLLDPAENPAGRAWDPMAIRYLLLSAHYRSKLNFTFSALEAASSSLEGIGNFLRRLRDQRGTKEADVAALAEECRGEFDAAVEDDLNTPQALAAVFRLVCEGNRAMDVHGDIGTGAAAKLTDRLLSFDRVLGLRLERFTQEESLPPEVRKLVEERQAARKARDFQRSDCLRDELLNVHGIVLEDTPQGVRWKRTQPI
ncbi:MAG: cysteine--tRNA ligase [Candidatus Eremiobacterota bacterium]